jgi:hypothetical protein
MVIAAFMKPIQYRVTAFLNVMFIASLFFPSTAAADPMGQQCRFSVPLHDTHVELIKLGRIIRRADETVVRLHHTSIRYGYVSIERAWSYINANTDPMLDRLTDLQIALDSAAGDEKKHVAGDLIVAYQHAADQLFDYAHEIVYDERTENAASKFLGTRYGPISTLGIALGFGVVQNPTRTEGNGLAHDQLTEKSTLFTDALLSLRLPEYRYARFCHTAFSDDIKETVDATTGKSLYRRQASSHL